jgi:putative transposase
MNTKQLSKLTGVTDRWLRALSKKALENAIDYIVLEDIKYHVKLLTTTKSRGKVYEYTLYEDIENQRKLAQLEASKLEAEQERLALADLFIPTPTKLTARDRLNIITNYGLSGKSVNEYVCWANDVYKDLKLTSRKLRLWQDKFAKGGIDALKDTRSGNNTKIDKKLLREVVLSKGLVVHKTNLYDLYRAKWIAKNKGKIDFDEKNCISYDAFNKAVNRLVKDDRDLYLLATKGQDALLNEHFTTSKSVYQDITINDEWQIDGSPLDYMLVNDDGVQERYKIVSIRDSFSGRMVWSLWDNSNSYSLVRTLAKALITFGKPKVIIGDNGKDYLSKHFQEVLERLGIRYQNHRPYKGKDKGGVERGFKTGQHGPLELLDNFIGHSVKERQIQESRAVEKSARIGGDKSYINTDYDISTFRKLIDDYIGNTLATKYSWQDKWDEELKKGVKPIFLDEAFITRSLGKQTVGKKVGREGIRYNNIYYVADFLWVNNYINKRVNIVENIDNIQELYVYDDDYNLLCTCVNRELQILTIEEARNLEKITTAHKRKIINEMKALQKQDRLHTNDMFNLKRIEQEVKKEKVECLMKKSRDENESEDEPTVPTPQSVALLQDLRLN